MENIARQAAVAREVSEIANSMCGPAPAMSIVPILASRHASYR